MNNLEKKLQILKEQTKKVTLEEKDKHVLRLNLEAYVGMLPAASKMPTHATLASLRKKMQPSFLTFARGITAGIVGAVLIGGGVASAATDALPGDPLYPVKINLNEKVRSLVAVTPEAQAKLQTEFAEARLQEAEKLAIRGDLSPSVKQTLEARFEQHAEASENSLEQIEGPDKEEVAAEVQSDFEAALVAHEELLSQLAASITSHTDTKAALVVATTSASSTNVDASSSTTTKNATSSSTSSNDHVDTLSAKTSEEFGAKMTLQQDQADSRIQSLLDWVRGKKEEIMRERENSEQKMWDDVAAHTKDLTIHTKAVATTQIQEAEYALEHDGDDVLPSVKAEAEKHLVTAKENMKTGGEQFDKGEYADAFTTYRKSMREGLQAEMLIKTSSKLDLYAYIKQFGGTMNITASSTGSVTTDSTSTAQSSTSTASSSVVATTSPASTATSATTTGSSSTTTTVGKEIKDTLESTTGISL